MEEAIRKKYGGIWSCPTDLSTLREKALLLCVILGTSRNMDDEIRFFK